VRGSFGTGALDNIYEGFANDSKHEHNFTV